VVFEGNDVFGDGVNIASRLEPLAPIGGILVSESVHKNILNKTDLQSKFAREVNLKNVKEPLRVYQVMVSGSELGRSDPKKKNGVLTQLKSVSKKVIISIVAVITLLFLVYFFYAKPDGLETVPGNGAEVIDKSIAVLPFVNMSGDPEQEYFSDGMTEEILNHLFKVGELKVTSRTSMMQYKGSDKSISKISKELGVAYILEGSVRKSGDKIRITVQLIDTETDQHLWSETYDRELTDVFAIQSEVAQQVASQLNIRLQPEVIQRMDRIPTKNMEAYKLYLKALHNWGNSIYFGSSRDWLEKAIELDSSFSTAYALLGSTILFEAGYAGNKNSDDVATQANANLEKALLLNPTDGIAHTMMGNYYLWFEKDFTKAEIEYRSAMELAPSDVTSYLQLLDLLLAADRIEEAILVGNSLFKDFDVGVTSWARMGLVWAFNNDLDNMNKAISQAKLAPPENVFPYIEAARYYLIQKQYDQIPEVLALSPDAQTVPRSMGLKAIAYHKIDKKEYHIQELNSLIQRSEETSGGSPSFYTAMVYASRGEVEEAFSWLEKSFEDNEIELFWLKVEPEFASLYDDARWQEMLDRISFPEI